MKTDLSSNESDCVPSDNGLIKDKQFTKNGSVDFNLTSRLKSDLPYLKPGHFLEKVIFSKSFPNVKNGEIVDEFSDNSMNLDNDCIENKDENWFKTWPECSGYDKNVKCLNNEENIDNSSKCKDGISLDNLLTSLPIAYSPITKQIHLLPEKPKENGNICKTNTEASSFSSIVSSLSDTSPCCNEITGINYDDENISIGNCSLDTDDASSSDKPKRKVFSNFFSRNVFNWKIRSESQNTSDGWTLFSKSINPNKEFLEDKLSIGDESDKGSSGLIQLDRPNGLPGKSKEEQKAHSDQHQYILRSAKKKELKDAKQRKKMLILQLKAEDELAQATRVWIQEILPKWNNVKNQKRTLDMWWQGVPPCVRGKLWKLAINNDLNITHDLYDICVSRAQERLKGRKGSTESMNEYDNGHESSMESIQLDISRTFPNLCIFQKGGPYYEMLHSLLAAYVCYRPDVGYVQGMSFIAAILILNMDAPDAFICFANLLNRPCHRTFYSLDQLKMEAYYKTYNALLKENLPNLYTYLESTNLTPDLYLLDWVYTIFAKAMALDLASRMWDVFLRDGDQFIFRAAIGILQISQMTLLNMDFLAGSKYLTKLPEDLNSNDLFKAISSIKMCSGKINFDQILSNNLQRTQT